MSKTKEELNTLKKEVEAGNELREQRGYHDSEVWSESEADSGYCP